MRAPLPTQVTRAKYKERQAALKSKVDQVHEVARQAREKIVEDRRQDAERMRSFLKQQASSFIEEQQVKMNLRKGDVQDIVSWKKTSKIEPFPTGLSRWGAPA